MDPTVMAQHVNNRVNTNTCTVLCLKIIYCCLCVSKSSQWL